MLCATWIIAFAGVLAALAAIASALYVRKGIAEQTRNFEKQTTAYQLSLSVEMALRLDQQFNQIEFRKIRSLAAKALLYHANEGIAEDIFDFFDSIGLFVKLGAFRDEIAHSYFFHWINLYWHAGKQHIGMKQKETSEVWKDFETLYRKVCAIEKRKNPESDDLKMPTERLREQLQDEADLLE
ncbi:MAG TPA: hypothetical protein VN948_13160 [Terriglobales bacterium]|nr:hypothetical protein [Terriglobales bacterium]